MPPLYQTSITQWRLTSAAHIQAILKALNLIKRIRALYFLKKNSSGFSLIEVMVVGVIMSIVGMASMQLLKSNFNAVKTTSEIATKNMNFSNLVTAASTPENLKYSALNAIGDSYNRLLSKCYAATGAEDCVIQRRRNYEITPGSAYTPETKKENQALLEEGYIPFALYVKSGAQLKPLSGPLVSYTKTGKLCNAKDADPKCILKAETYFLPECPGTKEACDAAINYRVIVRLYQTKKDISSGNLDLGDKRVSTTNPIYVSPQASTAKDKNSGDSGPKKQNCNEGQAVISLSEENKIECGYINTSKGVIYKEGPSCLGAYAKNTSGCYSPTANFTCCRPEDAKQPACDNGLTQVGIFYDRFGDWGRDLRWVAMCR
jgi:prepilin-type N-terminal cleavage/methylation domain-containing protein